MASDGKLRKHQIPQNYAPYLQKMGIYDLFYDISVSFALNQPEDHLIYMRNYLCSLQDKAEQIKILIIGSPHIDKRTLANEISEKLNLLVISLKDIEDENTEKDYSPKRYAQILEKIIEQKMDHRNGWILYDYPRDRAEGRAMRRRAINPTHSFQLIPSQQYYTKRDLWNENLIDKDPQEFKEMIECYRRRLTELKATFADTLKEVVIRGRTLRQIAKALVISAKQIIKRGAYIPRIVVIGEMSKKIENVVKEISEYFDLVFINMDEVVCQGKLLDSELGKHIRLLEKRQVPIYGKLVIALIQNRLMGIDCLNEGWLMINFPRDRADLEALDTFDTPPNKIIFLIPSEESKRELFRDLVDIKPKDEAAELFEMCEKKDDKTNLTVSSEKLYTTLNNDQIQDLLEYCGQHCAFIDSNLPSEKLLEIFKKIVAEPAQRAPPRVPTTKEEKWRQLLTNRPDDIECKENYKEKEPVVETRIREVCESESFRKSQSSSTSNSCSSSSSEEIFIEDNKAESEASSCLEIFPWKPKFQDTNARDEIVDILDNKRIISEEDRASIVTEF